MKNFLFIAVAGFLVTGCFKKIEEANELDFNMFDREYAGEQWFIVKDQAEFVNGLGQQRVRATIEIPLENLPELRSSTLDLTYSWNYETEEDWIFPMTNTNLNTDGGYTRIVTTARNDENFYCLSAGVYLEDEDSLVINPFTECFSIE